MEESDEDMDIELTECKGRLHPRYPLWAPSHMRRSRPKATTNDCATVTTSVGYFADMSPLTRRIRRLSDAAPAASTRRLPPVATPEIIVIDEEEPHLLTESDTMPAINEEKKRPLTGAQRQEKFRAKQKAKKDEKKLMDADKDALFSSLRRTRNKFSQYCDSNLLLIVKTGTCPSAGVARAPLRPIVTVFFLF